MKESEGKSEAEGNFQAIRKKKKRKKKMFFKKTLKRCGATCDIFLIKDNFVKMLLCINCPGLAFHRKSTVTFKRVCKANCAI